MICWDLKNFVLTVILLSLLRTDSVYCLRLCGRRLADILNFHCKRYGGFHAPGDKRSGFDASRNKHSSVQSGSDTLAEEAEADSTITEFQFLSDIRSGIVNECCRKQCSLQTLKSYCASGVPFETDGVFEDVDDSPSFYTGNIGSNPEEATEEPPRPLNFSTEKPHYHIGDTAITRRPNLGLSSRNRPIFIVLPHVPEMSSSDMSTEESL